MDAGRALASATAQAAPHPQALAPQGLPAPHLPTAWAQAGLQPPHAALGMDEDRASILATASSKLSSTR